MESGLLIIVSLGNGNGLGRGDIPVSLAGWCSRHHETAHPSVEPSQSTLGRSRIEPEHLLLGMLNEVSETGGGLATYILQDELGVNLAQLKQQLEATMSR
jgi:hypothetical protein